MSDIWPQVYVVFSTYADTRPHSEVHAASGIYIYPRWCDSRRSIASSPPTTPGCLCCLQRCGWGTKERRLTRNTCSRTRAHTHTPRLTTACVSEWRREGMGERGAAETKWRRRISGAARREFTRGLGANASPLIKSSLSLGLSLQAYSGRLYRFISVWLTDWLLPPQVECACVCRR